MKVLVRGSGDVASAVAHRLFGAGYPVLIQEVVRPAYIRRGMAFTDAVFEGKADLQGVLAKRPPSAQDVQRMLSCHRAIPVFIGSLPESVQAFAPDVLVDARMRKRVAAEPQRGLAPLSIGLGPGFTAGHEVDLVVETAWGPQLGRVIRQGTAQALAGEPAPIEGVGRDRCVYAAAAGEISHCVAIGSWAEAGEEVARLDGQPVLAPVSGHVRGICHAGAAVEAGAKIVEMDPRREAPVLYGLGERPRRIAEGVLAAIEGNDT